MKTKPLIGYVVLAGGHDGGEWPTRLAYRIFDGRRRFHLVISSAGRTCFKSRSAADAAIAASRLFHEAEGTPPPVYLRLPVEPS